MQSFKGSQAGPVVCYAVTVNVDPQNQAQNSASTQDVAIPDPPGCLTGQRVFINLLADVSTPGYLITNPRIQAPNTVRLVTANVTAGGALNPAALDISFVFLGQKSQA